jgi:GAF domain-containing protein
VTTRDEIGELAEAFNEMTDQLQRTLSGLEQRVAERTEVLEASVDVSRATTSLLDPDVLVRQVANLVRERFDLYYVGLFLVDEEGRFAVLRAGTGEAGQEMLSRGHQLGVGSDSMIGQCISSDAARIAEDVGAEAVRFENPLLPDTRSELALPMRSRGRVIGAMTVQSDEGSAFDAAYISVLQAMADQIAVAIDNARLYAESDTALAALEAAQRRYVGQAWTEYLRQQTLSGYRDTGAGIQPIEQEVLPEAQRAMGQGDLVIGEDTSLSAPIIDRGQTIGALGFAAIGENDQGRAWSEDELAILEAVRTQFAQVADNLRLLDQTQRGQAREQAIGQVTSSIRQSLEIDEVLRTAAEQIRETLGLGKAVVRLAVPEQVLSDGSDESEE